MEGSMDKNNQRMEWKKDALYFIDWKKARTKEIFKATGQKPLEWVYGALL